MYLQPASLALGLELERIALESEGVRRLAREYGPHSQDASADGI